MFVTLGTGSDGEGQSLSTLADGTGPLRMLEKVSRMLKWPYSVKWLLGFPLSSALSFLLCAV